VSYISKDEQILLKIRKYIIKLRDLYEKIQPMTDAEIEESIEGLAFAQCMTNLFELSILIEDDETAEKILVLSSGKTARIRNISSHNYDALNWSVVKNNCVKILRSISESDIDGCLKRLAEKRKNEKDYT